MGELERRGMTVELNRISRGTPVCLFNSFNFDFRRLRRFARDGCRMVHRVDGPISSYRGFDDGTDARIAEVNRELADATVVQSRYSLDAHRALGIELTEPVLIPNAVDPAIFHPPAEREPLAGRRVRIISTSWSDNPNKGADVLAWLDANLDWERYELTFVGQRSQELPAHPRRAAHPVGGRRRRAAPPRRVPRPEPSTTLRRTHCSRLLPAGCRPCTGGAAAIPSSSATVVFRSTRPRRCRTRSMRSSSSSTQRRNAIRTPSLSEIADRYLEVLRA